MYFLSVQFSLRKTYKEMLHIAFSEDGTKAIGINFALTGLVTSYYVELHFYFIFMLNRKTIEASIISF